jgi:hypothetical protein
LIGKFKEAGLALPSIPTAFKDALFEWEPWLLASQPHPEAYMDYARDSLPSLRVPTPDQIAISHAGHGINSYALNFRLALGPLALLVQQSWGGVYGDSAAEAQAWGDLVGRVSSLIESLDSPARAGWHQREFLLTAINFRTNGFLLEAFRDGQWVKLIETTSWDELLDELNGPRE